MRDPPVLGTEDKLAIEGIQDFTRKLQTNVEQVIVGKPDVIEIMAIALLCEGHVLLEIGRN